MTRSPVTTPDAARTGILLCAASALGYATMPILGKAAYAAGAGELALLTVRFGIAALLLWVLVAWRRPSLDWGLIAKGMALGAVAFAGEAYLYMSAVRRIDAGLAALLVYIYPSLVTAAAIALGRERADTRRWVALGAASIGVVLVLAGGGLSAGVDPIGIAMAITTGFSYAGFVLISESVTRRLAPLPFAASISTGAFLSLSTVAVILGGLGPTGGTAGIGWAAALAVLCTVGPMALFFAGLRRVGPSTAAIASTIEPAVTVLLGALTLGEMLGAAQAVGGALVLSAVFVLQAPPPRTLRGWVAARRGAWPRILVWLPRPVRLARAEG
jgi:drug/metabolite transporter (DMT)-like permease